MKGLELSEQFFVEDAQPLLDRHFPGLNYSAGLIGPGSEVLGFDDEVSRDHDWGPRFILFLSDADRAKLAPSIDKVLKQNLPRTCHGYSTGISTPDDKDVRLVDPDSTGEINHYIEIVTIRGYFGDMLGVDLLGDLSHLDWLSFPQHILLSLKSGRIFHDDLGLQNLLFTLDYYPHDIWLYVMASVWQRIGQEEHLAARASNTGQSVGYAVIASRLVKDVMRLGFLLERKYIPYAKWLENSFRTLDCRRRLTPLLSEVMRFSNTESGFGSLCMAFEVLAGMHNELAVTRPVATECRKWYSRGFMAIHGGQIAENIRDAIRSSRVRALCDLGLIGNIDLISDNTDVLENCNLRRSLVEAVLG